MFKIKKPLIAAAVSMALGLGIAAGANAAPVLFDTHDAAGGIVEITGFDWAASSFVAVGGQTAIGAFVGTGGACPAGSCNFQVLTHANLASFQNAEGSIGVDGLNTRYQITMLLRFTETVTGISINPATGDPTASFVISPQANAGGVLEFYYNTIAPPAAPGEPPAAKTAANNLTGFGFNDGKLILRANTIIDPATGTFTVDVSEPFTLLDQSPNGNQYGPSTEPALGLLGFDQQTVTGSGGTGVLNLGDITIAPDYFLSAIAGVTLDLNNISQSLPYETVDPSDCFTQVFANTIVGTNNVAYACTTAHVDGLMSANGAGVTGTGGYVPIIGPINGLFALGAPDFVAQTDFNSNISANDVPEPTSLALIGLGLGVLGFAARRRRTKAA